MLNSANPPTEFELTACREEYLDAWAAWRADRRASLRASWPPSYAMTRRAGRWRRRVRARSRRDERGSRATEADLARATYARMLADTLKVSAEQQKLGAEQQKFGAEQAKLYAEGRQLDRDNCPTLITALSAFVAGAAATAALLLDVVRH